MERKNVKHTEAHGLDELGLGQMSVVESLQIGHTEEDCKLSNILASATGKALLVDYRIVYIFETNPEGPFDQVLRMEISASDRHRVLAGKPCDVKLRPPSPGHRLEDMDERDEA